MACCCPSSSIRRTGLRYAKRASFTAFARTHEHDAAKPEQHHCPGRGLRYGGGNADVDTTVELTNNRLTGICDGVLDFTSSGYSGPGKKFLAALDRFRNENSGVTDQRPVDAARTGAVQSARQAITENSERKL